MVLPPQLLPTFPLTQIHTLSFFVSLGDKHVSIIITEEEERRGGGGGGRKRWQNKIKRARTKVKGTKTQKFYKNTKTRNHNTYVKDL